jgi:hypothetical protein
MERLRDSISHPWMRRPFRPSGRCSAPAALSSFSSASTSISSLVPPVSCSGGFCFAILVQMLTMTRTVSVETGSNLERAVGLGADHGLELLSLLKIT